ncbi:MAG: pro-sigmaK processing inhibitor BofA family protein [Eubacteriales bacterium]|jgi:inhibitor of the pro-sigma K processing machinery
MKDILLFLFGAAILIVALRVFKAPIRLALKILLNTILGFVALILFDLVGSYIGVSLGVNLLNSIVIGILGAPGFGLLLMARWLLIL